MQSAGGAGLGAGFGASRRAIDNSPGSFLGISTDVNNALIYDQGRGTGTARGETPYTCVIADSWRIHPAAVASSCSCVTNVMSGGRRDVGVLPQPAPGGGGLVRRSQGVRQRLRLRTRSAARPGAAAHGARRPLVFGQLLSWSRPGSGAAAGQLADVRFLDPAGRWRTGRCRRRHRRGVRGPPRARRWRLPACSGTSRSAVFRSPRPTPPSRSAGAGPGGELVQVLDQVMTGPARRR